MRPDQYDPLPRVFWRSLIAVGIVVLLVALLLPAIQQSREIVSYGPTCKTNLKQIGLAFHNYFEAHAALPPQVSEDPALSWRVALLPYVDQAPLSAKYDRTQTWNSAGNWPLAQERVPVYACPQSSIAVTPGGPFYTSYAMPVGEGTVFQGTRVPKFADITDGLSNTLFVVEACDQKIIWSEPRDVLLDKLRLGINQGSASPGSPPPVLSSSHPDGAYVVLANGAARFLSDKIDPETLRRLLLARDGMPVYEF